MKSNPSVLILADDLTGAAEIATALCIATTRLISSTAPSNAGEGAKVIVRDTDSRLLDAKAAARRVRQAVLTRPGSFLLKKTDSILRGPVLSELAALLSVTGTRRALLIPGHPTLGRIVSDGRMMIDGHPIDETVFSRDPHHPATSSHIFDLLGPCHKHKIHLLRLGDALPDEGIAVGEAATIADLEEWSKVIDRQTLPAGSTPFLLAVLARRGHPQEVTDAALPTDGPTLILSGSTARPPAPQSAVCLMLPVDVQHVRTLLESYGLVWVAAPERRFQESNWIPDAFAELTRQILAHGGLRHLVIEGGATAAAVTQSLNWDEFSPIASPSPGIATLIPSKRPDVILTLKPGSYPWNSFFETVRS